MSESRGVSCECDDVEKVDDTYNEINNLTPQFGPLSIGSPLYSSAYSWQ